MLRASKSLITIKTINCMWTIMLEPLLISDFFFFTRIHFDEAHTRTAVLLALFFSYVVNDPVEFKFLI